MSKLQGQYEILAEIGQGALGKVFKGRDIHLDKIVAIKELQLDNPSALRDEAQVLSDLRHENIVGFRQFFPNGNRWYLVMDYVEGGNLAEWVRTKKLYNGGLGPSLQRICSLAAQAAEGLGHAHKHNIIHQDVKPANIMVTSTEVAKVSDFGLANAGAVADSTTMGSKQDPSVTFGGLTPAFCSPEQARKERLTSKTDCWSWGLSVLEMFAGGLFWRIGTQAQEALALFTQGPPDRFAVGRMPDPVRILLQQCFAHDQKARPTLVEAARILRNAPTYLPKPEYERAESAVDSDNDWNSFGPFVKDTTLHEAAASGDVGKVRECLSKGYKINGKDSLMGTPLHYAANKGRTETVQLLISSGANVNAKGNNNWTPLHFAANKGQIEIVRLLVSHGANIRALGKAGESPVSLAESRGRYAVAEFLMTQRPK
jgi:serine/threonine protein kinase